jgi:hypothetical protein
MKKGTVIRTCLPKEIKAVINKFVSLPLLVLLSCGLTLSLVACGGGGGGGGATSSTTQSATITGTVLGTTLMAVDATTNAVVASVVADPSTETFSMQLPIGANYKFYLVENAGTTFQRSYPLYMFNQGQNQNVFSISQAATINFGFMDITSGAAVPALGLSQMQSLGINPVSFDSTVPSTLAGTVFGSADMQGAWNVHGIADNGAWFHTTTTTMTIGANGLVDMSSLVSNNTTFGNALAARPMSLSVMPGGIINFPNDSNFNAFMGSSRSMFVATDLFSNAHQMFIAQKAPVGTINPAALTGTWQAQGIISGSAFNGWMQGSVNISGTSMTSQITLNNGSNLSLGGNVQITATGEITMANSGFHGTTSDDGNTIVATLTDASGDACLLVLQKSANISHTDADFGGTWYMHNVAVVSGSADGRADFGAAHFDTSGNAMMERFSTDPAFTTTPSSLLSFSMTMNGLGMMSGMSGFPGMMGGAMMGGMGTAADFGGFMNVDNSLFITNMTNTQNGTNWGMMILQK